MRKIVYRGRLARERRARYLQRFIDLEDALSSSSSSSDDEIARGEPSGVVYEPMVIPQDAPDAPIEPVEPDEPAELDEPVEQAAAVEPAVIVVSDDEDEPEDPVDEDGYLADDEGEIVDLDEDAEHFVPPVPGGYVGQFYA